jgi:hypothetical protein
VWPPGHPQKESNMRDFEKMPKLRDMEVNAKKWASPFSCYVNESPYWQAILLDTSFSYVDEYEYPFMLFVWRREDGFYVGWGNEEKTPNFFIKATHLAERDEWSKILEKEEAEYKARHFNWRRIPG